MSITLYTTHCPQCAVLEKQLKDKRISFTTCEDVDLMINKGFRKAPMLEVDEQLFNFPQALKWVKEQ